MILETLFTTACPHLSDEGDKGAGGELTNNFPIDHQSDSDSDSVTTIFYNSM